MSAQQTLVIPSKRTLWTIRIVLLGLVGIWLVVATYLHYQVRQARAAVEQERIEANRRQEYVRRGVQYKQELQERTQTPQTRNAFDKR